MPTLQAIAFTKVSLPFGWLGNMSPHSVEHDGLRWRTAEALFQALRFDDPAIREEIRAAKSPMAAKFIAKRHKDGMVVEPRSAEDVDNMELVVRLKLAQYPNLQAELLATGDRLIVEDSSSRHGESARFWGAALVAGRWVGQNVLGRLWMELRQELRPLLRARKRSDMAPGPKPSDRALTNTGKVMRRAVAAHERLRPIRSPAGRAAASSSRFYR